MAISLGTAALGGGLLQGVGSLFGAGKGADAATQAAKLQAQTAQQAQALTLAMFNQFQTNLSPWLGIGKTAVSRLAAATGVADAGTPANTDPFISALAGDLPTQFQGAGIPYSAPNALAPGGAAFAPQGIGLSWQPTMAQLEQTPGFQFARDQGLLATQNSFAAQGLGSSGAALKGAANYAEGLASTTYQQQFGNWLAQLQQQYGMFSGERGSQFGIFQGNTGLALQQRQQQFNMLGALAGTGQNAAVNLGTSGLTAAGQAGAALTAGGAALAGGVVGSANALNAGLAGATGGVSSGLQNFALLNALGVGNQPLFGGTSSGTGVNPLGLQLSDQALTGPGLNFTGTAPGIGTGGL